MPFDPIDGLRSANDSIIRAKPTMLEQAIDALIGIIGLPGPDTSGRRFGELIQAGLPFVQLGKLRGLKQIAGKPAVFHGTKTSFNEFDPAKLNPEDTLGWMIHAAEDPVYAATYTADRPGSNIIPITSTAQNVLDITRVPSADDWKALKDLLRVTASKRYDPAYGVSYPDYFYKNLPRSAQRALVDNSPYSGEIQRRMDSIRRYAERQANITNRLRNSSYESPESTYERALISGVTNDPILTRWLETVRSPLNDPKLAKLSGFDAIRYLDDDKVSWAFPRLEQLSTPWGTPLGKPIGK